MTKPGDKPIASAIMAACGWKYTEDGPHGAFWTRSGQELIIHSTLIEPPDTDTLVWWLVAGIPDRS